MPNFIRSLLKLSNALPVTWVVLAIPALPLIWELYQNERYYAEIMYESGILSVQLLVFSLLLTPVQRLTRQWRSVAKGVRWFVKRRRAIGIASFGYATLHALFYIRHTGSLELVWLNVPEVEIATGWVAFIILLLLAITSNNASQRWLSGHWKTLQRGAYFAAAITALHWALFDQFIDDLVMLALPLVIFQVVRVALRIKRLNGPQSSDEPQVASRP